MKKQLYIPHLGHYVKLSRKRPVSTFPRVKLSSYLTGALPAPPASCDYRSKALAALTQMYLNDSLGDCVIAGGYHVVGLETGNATGTPFIATQAQIIRDYQAIGGYVPGNPNTDNGCDEQTALNYWTSHGFANGTKLCGWLSVDPTNPVEIRQAMFLFENLFFGLELPDAWISPFPSTNGFVWNDGTPDPNNGHCIMGTGYTAQGVTIDTWGLFGTITYAAIRHLCALGNGGELYVLLSPDQIAKGQTKAPNGFAWADLISDFDTLGGNVPPPAPVPTPPPAPVPTPPAPPVPTPPAPPVPTPPAPPVPTPPAPPVPTPPVPPTPPTPPTQVVTLQQAIAWATQGLMNNWPKSH